MELREIIKTYRVAAGLSQDELAKATGYTDRSSIAQIERGSMDIPRSKLKMFARVLKIPMSLLTDEEPANVSTGAPRLPEDLVIVIAASGFKVEPSFDPGKLDFGDMTSQCQPPPEIYNVIDLSTARLARFTGDELRDMPSDVRLVQEAFDSRCITGTTARGLIYKLIDSLPEDKLPIIEAYLDGLSNR